MKPFVILLLFFACFPCYQGYCQNYCNDEPWEWEDVQNIKKLYAKNDANKNISNDISYKLISLYRRKITINSIARCPFKISCSEFAYRAISRYGVFKGICLFLDRNFYRENNGMLLYYSFEEDENGLLKLEDSFYLYLK